MVSDIQGFPPTATIILFQFIAHYISAFHPPLSLSLLCGLPLSLDTVLRWTAGQMGCGREMDAWKERGGQDTITNNYTYYQHDVKFLLILQRAIF